MANVFNTIQNEPSVSDCALYTTIHPTAPSSEKSHQYATTQSRHTIINYGLGIDSLSAITVPTPSAKLVFNLYT